MWTQYTEDSEVDGEEKKDDEEEETKDDGGEPDDEQIRRDTEAYYGEALENETILNLAMDIIYC